MYVLIINTSTIPNKKKYKIHKLQKQRKYIRNSQNNRIQKKESKIAQFFASEMF